MLCDNCKERDAIINLTQVEHDSKVTLHLCEQCAQQKGVETGGAILKSPLGNFLGAVVKGGSTAGALVPASGDTLRCPACGSSLRDFRDSGRLGCDRCYVSFDTHLRDLLRRLHGSSQHVGERYALPGEGGSAAGAAGAEAGVGADSRSRLLELKAQLRRAVEGENFELAAELRDQIRVLE
jgi:protein arginine kinase activator